MLPACAGSKLLTGAVSLTWTNAPCPCGVEDAQGRQPRPSTENAPCARSRWYRSRRGVDGCLECSLRARRMAGRWSRPEPTRHPFCACAADDSGEFHFAVGADCHSVRGEAKSQNPAPGAASAAPRSAGSRWLPVLTARKRCPPEMHAHPAAYKPVQSVISRSFSDDPRHHTTGSCLGGIPDALQAHVSLDKAAC